MGDLVPLVESTDNRPIFSANRPIPDRDSQEIREILDMPSIPVSKSHYPFAYATEAVCHVAQEEAIAIRNGARRLYKALAGVGAGVALFWTGCIVLTAFKPIDIHYTTEPAIVIRRSSIPELDMPLRLKDLRRFDEPQSLAYTIPGVLENFSSTERRVLFEVASEYALDKEQTVLLFAIRKIENGRPGLELGCGDGTPGHPARRYAGHFERSLRLQAQWASGTIRNHWDGDFHAFARQYCPLRQRLWARNATKWVGILSQAPREELAFYR